MVASVVREVGGGQAGQAWLEDRQTPDPARAPPVAMIVVGG